MFSAACYHVFYATYNLLFLHLDQMKFWFTKIKLSLLIFQGVKNTAMR